MDNLTKNEQKRLELLTSIQEMISSDYKYSDIASALGISTRTVLRYKNCNPKERCRIKRPTRNKEIYQYKGEIITLIREGYHATGIAQKMKEGDCKLSISTLRKYARIFADECNIDISKNRKGPEIETKKKLDSVAAKTIILKKQDIIKFLWMNKENGSFYISELYRKYPFVRNMKACIDDFREIFSRKSMPRLYLFIEHYKHSEFPPIASFARGLERDIDAVENAVASSLSNGYVEGINNRTKMIKRSMYGRCGLELLSAKVMLPYA